MDALADKEAKQISMNSLQVGEEFEKDIKNIIEIIDGVEKNMCPQRLNQQFMRSANLRSLAPYRGRCPSRHRKSTYTHIGATSTADHLTLLGSGPEGDEVL